MPSSVITKRKVGGEDPLTKKQASKKHEVAFREDTLVDPTHAASLDWDPTTMEQVPFGGMVHQPQGLGSFVGEDLGSFVGEDLGSFVGEDLSGGLGELPSVLDRFASSSTDLPDLSSKQVVDDPPPEVFGPPLPGPQAEVPFDIHTMREGVREGLGAPELGQGLELAPKRLDEIKGAVGEKNKTKVSDIVLDMASGYQVEDLFKERGIPVNGGNERTGKYPTNKADPSMRYRAQLPKGPGEAADYGGMRSAQLLSQLGEIAYHALEKGGQRPVETQFGYGELGDGGLDLYASTNNKASQDVLAGLLDDPEAMVSTALKSGSKELQREALKLVYWKEQQEQRRADARGKDNEAELLEDLDRADKIHGHFFKGGVNLVKNSGTEAGPQGRHAEQNIAEVMKGKGYVRKDVQGTKYRCGGCTASIGHGMKAPDGKLLGGNMYSAQASKEDARRVLGLVKEDRARIVNASDPVRPRSSSIPRIPKPLKGEEETS